MKSLSRHAQGLIAINIAAIIFGGAALYGKMAVSPFWVVCIRAIFAGCSLLCLGLLKGDIKKPSRAEAIMLALTGIVLAVHWLSFFISVQLAGVAIATLTFSTFPMFTLFLEARRDKKWLNKTQIAASVIIVIAVSLLVHIDSRETNLLLGAISGLVSAVTFAWFGVVSKKLGGQLPTLSVSFYQNLVVAIVLLPTLPFASRMPDQVMEWGFLFMLGVITTALMHQLYFYALQRLPASTCSGFVALEPIYAIVFAALLFSDPITPVVILSGVMIVGSSFMLLKSQGEDTEMM